MSDQAQAPKDTDAADRLQRLTTKHQFPSNIALCGSELLAKAVCQATSLLNLPTPSRAGSLPQGWCASQEPRRTGTPSHRQAAGGRYTPAQL